MTNVWQPWETAPIHDGEVELLVAVDLRSIGRGIEHKVFQRKKISNGYMHIIGNNFSFDERQPFAWTHFTPVTITPESAK